MAICLVAVLFEASVDMVPVRRMALVLVHPILEVSARKHFAPE
jgi:hypothetical protein